MAKFEFQGKKPVVGETSYVHENATLIGDVTIGESCFIGPGASLRADFGTIRIGDRSSVQDNCVIHCRPGDKCIVGNDVTLGHACVLHGCEIKDRTIIGINAVVSDGTVVGEDSIVAESAMVRGGQEIPAGSLVAGVPAVVKGQLNDKQRLRKDAGAKAYAQLAKMCRADLKKIEE